MSLRDKISEDEWKQNGKIYLLSQAWITSHCLNAISNKNVGIENLTKDLKGVIHEVKRMKPNTLALLLSTLMTYE